MHTKKKTFTKINNKQLIGKICSHKYSTKTKQSTLTSKNNS